MIAFSCPKCQTKLQRNDAEAGTKVLCPSCNQKLLVPTPSRLQGDATAASKIPPTKPDRSPISVKCPSCELVGTVPSRFEGKRVTCQRCGTPFTLAGGTETPQANATAERPNPKPLAATTKELGSQPAAPKATRGALAEEMSVAGVEDNLPPVTSRPTASSRSTEAKTPGLPSQEELGAVPAIQAGPTHSDKSSCPASDALVIAVEPADSRKATGATPTIAGVERKHSLVGKLLIVTAIVGTLLVSGGVTWWTIRFSATPATQAASFSKPKSGDQIFKELLKSTVFVIQLDGPNWKNAGSGSLIHEPKRLVLTNYHVVGDKKETLVWFPAYQNGELITQPSHYARNWKGLAIAGRVVARDSMHDLALIQLASLPEGVQALRLETTSASPGQNATSVGASGVNVDSDEDEGTLWRYASGQVRQVYKRELVFRDQTINSYILETQSPTNPGDSGGPVVNDQIALVGVVSSLSVKDRLVTSNIDVREVRALLERYLQGGDLLAEESPPIHAKPTPPQQPTTDAQLIPKAALDHFERGVAALQKDDINQAIAEFSEAVQLAPRFAPAFAHRGRCFRLKGDLQTAREDLNKAVQLGPPDPRTFLWRADVNLADGKPFDAVRDCTFVLQSDPDSIAALEIRGDAFFVQAGFPGAIEDYTAIISKDPKNETVLRKRAYTYLVHGNRLALTNGQVAVTAWGKAVLDCNETLRLNPNNALALETRCRAQFNLGETDKAILDCDAAIQLNPSWIVYQVRGLAWQRKGDRTKAITDFTQAIQLNPEDNVSLRERGIAYAYQKVFSQAFDDLTAAIDIHKAAFSAVDPVAHYWRGRLYNISKKHDAAIADLNLAIRADRNFAKAYYERSRAYYAMNNARLGKVDYDKAFKLDPNVAKE